MTADLETKQRQDNKALTTKLEGFRITSSTLHVTSQSLIRQPSWMNGDLITARVLTVG